MSDSFRHVTDLNEVGERRPTFLAIGVFDGVHRGHQRLLQRMVAAARQAGASPAVLTFFPHPRVVIQGLSGRLYLTTLAERVRLLAAQGVDMVLTHTFDEEVRHMRARAFVEQLQRHFQLRQLWGGGFSLGYQREGDAAFLSRLGEEMGFTVHELQDMATWNGDRVSSSRIRRALAEGDIATVNGGLGRRFSVNGEVLQGDRRGRTIGFPTANLGVWEQQLLPANGVYAAWATLLSEPDSSYAAATNVGVRPTVNGQRLTVEAHLLDFAQEIYGERMRLAFEARIRPEMKFSGLEALKKQIAADVETVRRRFSQSPQIHR